MAEENNLNKQKGIHIEATKAQIVSSIILIIIMLFVPIFGYNYINKQHQPREIKVYTYSNILQQKESEKKKEQIAGIYTKSQDNSNLENQISFLKFLLTSSTFFIVFGTIMILTFIISTFSLVYNFFKV